MITLNTNAPALLAQNVLRSNEGALDQAMQRLSTGKRINSGADDGAGLAMSTRLDASAEAYLRGEANANQAISMLRHFASAGEIITEILISMHNLASLAATDTASATTRYEADANFNSLGNEWARIAAETRWTSVAAMDTFDDTLAIKLDDGPTSLTLTLKSWEPSNGTAGENVAGASVAALDDANADAAAAWSFEQNLTSAIHTGLADRRSLSHIQTQAAAQNAVDKLAATLDSVSEELGNLNSSLTRLNYAGDLARSMATELNRASSKIADADYARETTALARAQIVNQAATAMLAQANQLPQVVEVLLR